MTIRSSAQLLAAATLFVLVLFTAPALLALATSGTQEGSRDALANPATGDAITERFDDANSFVSKRKITFH